MNNSLALSITAIFILMVGGFYLWAWKGDPRNQLKWLGIVIIAGLAAYFMLTHLSCWTVAAVVILGSLILFGHRL